MQFNHKRRIIRASAGANIRGVLYIDYGWSALNVADKM